MIENKTNTKTIKYEPGFIKNNRMKFYRMLNDDIIFQEKKMERLLKRNKLYKNIDDEEENNIITNSNNLLQKENSLDNNISNSNLNNDNDNDNEIDINNSNKSNQENNIPNNNIKEIKNLERNYIYGLNLEKYNKQKTNDNKNKNYFIYHKKDKLIAFPNSDCIIIEKNPLSKNDKSKDIKEDFSNNQILLNYHKNKTYIKSLKLSLAENILYFYTIDNYIIFYKYNIQNNNFSYISEYLVKYNINIIDYIIDQNEIFCFILYDNYKLLILDYELSNELLTIDLTFLQKYTFKNIKLNKFTEHRIEFCIYSKENFSSYYLDTKELKLNEYINKIKFNNNKKEILCLDYLPPVSDGILLCIIICFNDGDIFIINLSFQNILQIYKVQYNIYDIVISPFYIYFISEEKLIFYNIPNLRGIKFHKIEETLLLDERKFNEIKHDSNIINYDIDTYTNNGYTLIFTEKANLYIDNCKEKKKNKLNTFLYEEQYINYCILIENINKENMKNNNLYYLITTHNSGILKVYGIPSYQIIYEFQIEKDEITYIIQIPKKLYFLVFSKTGLVRCFDIIKARSTGKLKVIDIISKDKYSTIPPDYNTYIKKAIFYPCGKFFIGVESYENNLILFTVDNIEPFSLKSKQIPYIQINTLNDILLNKIEPYQTFLITNNNNEIFVYERKYSSLITTFDLENDTPIYQKKDYINNTNLYKNNNLVLDENKINHNVCFYGFDTGKWERHYLYIYNYKFGLIILRDTKARKNLDIIRLKENIYSLIFFKNRQNFLGFINKDKIKICRLNNEEDLCINECSERSITKIKNNNKNEKLILSEDEKIIILINGNSFIVYLIKEE